MSILLAVASSTTLPSAARSAPTSVPSVVAAIEWLIWIVWAFVGLVVARQVGAFKRGSVNGPARLAPTASAFDLLVLMCVALGGEMMVSILVLHHLHIAPAMLELVAGAAGKTFSILAVLLAMPLLKVMGIRSIGLPIHRAAAGVAGGAVCLFILFPMVQLASELTMVVYRIWHFKIPDPHMVLQKMGETHSFGIKLLGFVLAAILAPVAEELFFRGLLQTALTRLFSWTAFEFASRGLGETPPLSAIDKPGTGSRWLAIWITAAIFALFHVEPAVMPALIVLAVGLGYAYERTGNLWITIAAHSLFNSTQILLYLTLK